MAMDIMEVVRAPHPLVQSKLAEEVGMAVDIMEVARAARTAVLLQSPEEVD